MPLAFWRRLRATLAAWLDMRAQRNLLADRVVELEQLVRDQRELMAWERSCRTGI